MFPESLIMSRFLKGFESYQRRYNMYIALSVCKYRTRDRSP